MAIGEDPETVSSYALRHTHITAQLLAGLPVQLVAKLHDTSASQIEKHYAATIASHTDELVRASMIEMDRPAAEVVPIVQIDDHTFAGEGPVTERLRSIYTDVVRGARPAPGPWLTQLS